MQSALPSPLAPGDVLAGKYQVERILGRGGMGIVVAARHIDLGELFAIKLLKPEAAQVPVAVERFLREARAAARLKGEHIAKVSDVGRLENGLPYIVMEYLAGTDLGAHLRARGPLPPNEAISHVLQACEAIAEAHGLGIVHRDLKPANLFLTVRANGTTCVKVLDFGISKQVADEGVDITKTGEALGTPLYMAPEQMARMKSADARSDIWSLGIVLYQLLTGTTPFHSTAVTEVVFRVLQEEPAPPSSLRSGLPAGLDAVILRCLQKRPDMRYSTIVELADALRATSGAPIDVSPRTSYASLPGAVTGVTPASAISFGSVLSPADATTRAIPSPMVAASPPVASTGSAWGATGQLKPSGTPRILLPLILGGVTLAALASVGFWLLAGSSGPSAASSSEPATDPSMSAGALVPAPSPSPSPSAASESPSTASESPSTAPTASAASSVSAAPSARASAAPTASASAKPGAWKPPVSTPPPPNTRFGGIR